MALDIPREGREQIARNHRDMARRQKDAAWAYRSLANTARADAERYDKLAAEADKCHEYFTHLADDVGTDKTHGGED